MFLILAFILQNLETYYYHLRSTMKREQTTVSTGPMKMFHLEHETMNVCQRDVAHFGHMECRF